MRRIFPLRAYYVASFAVGGVYLPYFPRWLEARGVHGLRLGIVSAAAPAMGVVAPAAYGMVADALGVRAGLLQLACAGALIVFTALSAAGAFGVSLGFAALLPAALVIALFRSPMSLIADVVALEHAPPLGTTYGRVRLWGSLGFLGAALLAGWWVDPRSALAFPLVCTFAVAAALGASMALPRSARLPDRAGRRGIGRLLRESDFRLFLCAAALGNCAQAAYDMCFSIRLFDLGIAPPIIGIAWALGTAAEVLLMAWSAPMFRSFSAPGLLALALLVAGARWALIAFVRSAPWLLLLQPLHGISFGLVWLAEVTYTARRFPAGSLGTAQGLFVTAMGAGSGVGMLIWGPVYERSGGSFVFAGAACFAVCASTLAFALDRKVRVPLESPVVLGK